MPDPSMPSSIATIRQKIESLQKELKFTKIQNYTLLAQITKWRENPESIDKKALDLLNAFRLGLIPDLSKTIGEAVIATREIAKPPLLQLSYEELRHFIGCGSAWIALAQLMCMEYEKKNSKTKIKFEQTEKDKQKVQEAIALRHFLSADGKREKREKREKLSNEQKSVKKLMDLLKISEEEAKQHYRAALKG